MDKKVAVVTGSSLGIGAAAARRFAQNGYNVVTNFSRDAAPAESVAQECRTFGTDTLMLPYPAAKCASIINLHQSRNAQQL